MRRYVCAGLLAGLALPSLPLQAAEAVTAAETADTREWQTGGHLRLLHETHQANDNGPLAPAAAWTAPGAQASRLELSAQLDAPWLHLAGTVQSGPDIAGMPAPVRRFDAAWLTRQGATTDGATWRLTAGKRVLSWDVGYAFRPLDVVQQENRRALLDEPLEGVPLLALELTGATQALTVVAANPTADAQTGGREENARVARGFARIGANDGIDLHLLARQGRRLGNSFGAALSGVISDSLEWHVSARTAQALERPQVDAANPAQVEMVAGWQGLIGGQWTGESRVSVLLEAWRDQSAPTPAQWRQWRRSTDSLPAAGLIARQAGALSAGKLQQDNLYARLAWTQDNWSPSADLLYMPEDAGWIGSLAVQWQGDRWQLAGGLRQYGGSPDALTRALPDRQIGYAWAKYAF